MAFETLLVAASSFNVQSVVLFVVVLLLAIAWIRRPRNLPPGPPLWSIIGSAKGLRKGPMHMALTEWARQYGSIMSVWMGPKLAVVLSDIQAVKEALVKQADCFSDRIEQPKLLAVPMKGSIIMSNGEVWKERRRFGLSALRSLGMGKRSVEHKITEEARHLLECFDGEGEKPFDPEHAVLNAVSNIICLISFGYRFEYTDPKFARLIKLVKTRLTRVPLDALGILQTIFSRAKRTGLHEGRTEVGNFIQEIVQEHEDSLDSSDLRDIIDMCLMECQQQEKGGKTGEDSAFCRSTLWMTVQDLFIAGTDTTTNTLLWLLLYMAIYPEVQNKVQSEIDDVIGSDRQPLAEDSADMPYTNAVLMEMQRHRPVTPSGVPHQTRYQTELCGYTIPAKTAVFVNLWAILHDPNCWKDPEEFDPSRFLSEDGKTVERPEAFIPFSFGRRICMGETLAKMEMFLFFVNLLQRFTFSLPAGKPLPSLEGIAGVTLAPIPFEIVAKKR